MAQMNVSLPEGLKAWAEARVAEGRYSSTSDYVRDLMRRDQEYAEQLAALKAMIDEGLESPETDTRVQDIVAEYRARR
jgi:antitoxin ParD1/3/4